MLSSSDTKCYKASRFVDKLNFKDAIDQCNYMNGTLAEPINEEENMNLATNSMPKSVIGLGSAIKKLKELSDMLVMLLRLCLHLGDLDNRIISGQN